MPVEFLSDLDAAAYVSMAEADYTGMSEVDYTHPETLLSLIF